MPIDPDTYDLFEASNFDPYDGDRYSPVLKAGLAQHRLEVSDVLAVTEGFGVWAICTAGIFSASLQGKMLRKKSPVVGRLIPYSEVTGVREEPSGPKTMRLVVMGKDSKQLASIDFGAGGMENTPEVAASHRKRIARILEQARSAARAASPKPAAEPRSAERPQQAAPGGGFRVLTNGVYIEREGGTTDVLRFYDDGRVISAGISSDDVEPADIAAWFNWEHDSPTKGRYETVVRGGIGMELATPRGPIVYSGFVTDESATKLDLEWQSHITGTSGHSVYIFVEAAFPS